MVFLSEYIKLRTERSTELTHLELDRNLQYVANPWSPSRAYLEGMVVYHGDVIHSTGDIATGDTATDGTSMNIGSLTWYRANKDTGPKTTFDYTDWDPIGESSTGGQIRIKDSNNNFNLSGVLEFEDSEFNVIANGNTSKVSVKPGAFNIWNITPDGISYEGDILIENGNITIQGDQHVYGDLTVNGYINNIDIEAFLNEYDNHSHTISALKDVQLSPLNNGDFLTWDNNIKRWVNTSATVSAHDLGSHSDVSSNASLPIVQDNQILIFNNTSNEWEAITLINDDNTGFSTQPFSHNHNDRYYTKNQLNTSGNGGQVHWDNIINRPNIPSNSLSYIISDSADHANLPGARVINGGTGITMTDNGAGNNIIIEQTADSVRQPINVRHNGTDIATESILNFVEPLSGDISYNITENNNIIDIEVNFTGNLNAPVTSVNSLIGDVILDVADINDVSIVPSHFPGAGTGTPYTPLTNILAYDDDIQKWVNIPATSLISGINSIYLNDILDVEISLSDLQEGYLLYYDDLNNIWVNGHANDAGIYLIDDLQNGALNNLYYTKSQLNTPGNGGQVHWDNIINEPNFAQADHTHSLSELLDVTSYRDSGGAIIPNTISDGDSLVWNSVTELWELTNIPGINVEPIYTELINDRVIEEREMYTVWGDFTLNAGQTLDIYGRLVIVNGEFIDIGTYTVHSTGSIEIVNTSLDYILGRGNTVKDQDIKWTDSDDDWVSGQSTAYFNQSTVDGNVYVTKEYVDSKALPGSPQIMAPEDKSLVSLETNLSDNLATNSPISKDPVQGSYISFKYNGVDYEVGDGVNTPVYFSNDDGVTAKTFNDIVAGDKIYWNSTIAGFELKAGGRISLEYLRYI